ncbi:unnamed protein product [Lactuca saligna]|uniref:Retrotransposon gag domain-containing protein n=1 Tax=Lactuca saligna TaxID=75948 RepID=A0AA35UM45_LACSI|nr:unnamed protein product [Lactuca saligna]
MSTQQEELMKKLEAFMFQQTQSNNDLKTNTNDLKAAMTALQTKQAAMEEGLQNLTHNKYNKQEEDNESVDKMFESEKFDDPSEQVRGRGRGATFGANPNSKFSYLGGWAGRGRGLTQEGARRGSSKVFDSWRTSESQPFKHNWDSLKLEGSNRRDHGALKDWEETEDTKYHGGRVPRFAKMEFPTYDGRGNPIEWLQRCEDFFEEQQTPTEAWVRHATFSLQGRAIGWYHNLRRMKNRLNWFEFSEECKIKFGPPMSINPLGELTRLRQTGTMEDYCEGFESLLGRTTRVTQEQSVWHFCTCLTNVIQYEVEFARPPILYYDMNLAREIEYKLEEEGQPRSFGAPLSYKNKNRESNNTGGTHTTKSEVKNLSFK